MRNDIILPLQKMKIHEKIRTIRQAKGLTQDYIADKLYLDTVNYGRIERGQAKLTMDRFLKIAEILNVKPNLFFNDDNKADTNNEIIILLKQIYETETQILKQLQNVKQFI